MTSPDTASIPHARRLRDAIAALAGAGIEALIVTSPPNLRYLTGFDGTMGALVVCGQVNTLVVDGRYATAAGQLAACVGGPGFLVERADGSLEATLASVVRRLQVSTVGVEAHVTTLTAFARLTEAVGEGVHLIPVSPLVERLRLVKDEWETAILRTAGRMLSSVAKEVLGWVRPGRAEREIAAEVDAALRRAGFERVAFDTIVASGPNSARPHTRPGTRTLEPGDGVVLDFGGAYGGYCVDLTRTMQLPPLTDEFGHLFEAVREARAAAMAAVRPGATTGQVDAAARQALARHGLAAAFVHGTGHGLGLEVHEAPRISATAEADEPLRPGMVFTIEPGVYVPGVGGVRLEDDVLVVDQGCELLTDVPIDRTYPGSGAPGRVYRVGDR